MKASDWERRWLWIALPITALFAALSLWKVFEYDLFYQIRYGEEILAHWKIQTVDLWSHTAYGKTFYNHEWLATVVDALAARVMPDFAFLGILRAALIGCWIFVALLLIRHSAHADEHSWQSAALAPILIAWIYVTCSFRFQMRPDLYATVHYALLLWLFQSEVSDLRKRQVGLFLLLSWANFHAGTVPFGILFFAAAIVFEPAVLRPRDKALWIAAAVATWVATPLGVHGPEVVWVSLMPAPQGSVINNPDFQPFSMGLLQHSQGGWCLQLWVLYSAFAVFSFFIAAKKWALPKPWNNQLFVGVIGVLLTLATLVKIRSIHYQVLFLLPLVARGGILLLKKVEAQFGRIGPAAVVGIAGLVAYGWILPDQVQTISKPLGLGLCESELPIASTAFLKANRPRGQLLNPYSFGGYLIHELPEYPVAVDGRGTQFMDFLRELNIAKSSTDSFAALLRRYSINVAMDTLPAMSYQPQIGFIDTQEYLYMRSEWALVFFDEVTVVYVRRIPEHENLIREHEYHFVKRGFPANYGAEFAGLSDGVRRGFELEFDRCLRDSPRNVYCLTGKAAFLELRSRPQEALSMLQEAEQVNPRDPGMLLVLSEMEKKLGFLDESEKFKRRFERLTIHP